MRIIEVTARDASGSEDNVAGGIIELTRNPAGVFLLGRIVWSSQSNGTEANNSTVTATLQLQRDASNTTTGTFKGTFTVGGVNKSISWFGSLPSRSWVTIETITTTVNHSANGAGSCYLAAKIDGPTGTTMEGTYVSGSSTVTFDVIARYATIKSVTDFTDEGNPIISYSNPAGNAVSSLQACISLDGSTEKISYKNIPKTGTEYAFPLTDTERNTLRAATPNSNSLDVYVLLKTVIGSASDVSSKPVRMSIVNADPIISPSVVDTNANTVSLTGDASFLVALHSSASVTVNASAQKYATIKSKRIEHGSVVLTGDGTFTVTNNPIKISATDSRGNTTTKNASNTVIPYINPTCLIGNNTPETDGSFSLVVSGLFYNGLIGKTANTLTVQYRYKAANGSYGNWITMGSVDKGTIGYEAIAAITGLDYQTTYVFQARAIDKINAGGIYSAEKVIISEPVFDWGQNDFNFNVPVTLGKGVTPTLLTSVDNLNNIRASGWYEWKSDSKPANIPAGSGTNYMSSMRVWKNGNTCYQECVESSDSNYRGGMVQRVLYGSTVYDWEWVNAPSEIGPEYRTIERWKGKPVYVKVVDCGTLPNKTSKYIQYAQSGVVDAPIDYYGVYSNQAVANAHVSFVMVVNKTHIIVDTPNDLSTQTLQVAVKYTKV